MPALKEMTELKVEWRTGVVAVPYLQFPLISRGKEWRVTIGLPLAVSTVSNFVPV